MSGGSQGQVVVSAGKETDIFQYLIEHEPLLSKYSIDAREYIYAPPKKERIHAVFPDARVVKQVRESKGFFPCVAACKRVLERYGLVFVYCKAGQHRAPTVASELSDIKRHVIHLSSMHVIWEDVLMLLRHSIHPFSSVLVTAGIRTYPRGRLCVGWDCRAWMSKSGYKFPAIQFGQAVEVLGEDQQLGVLGLDDQIPGTCVIRLLESGVVCLVLSNFLLPISICALHLGFEDRLLMLERRRALVYNGSVTGGNAVDGKVAHVRSCTEPILQQLGPGLVDVALVAVGGERVADARDARRRSDAPCAAEG